LYLSLTLFNQVNIMSRILLFLFIACTPVLVWAQCTINNSTDCECENPNDTDCDLLPDITVSWETGINGSEEYPPGEGILQEEIDYPENWFEIDDDVMAMGRIRVSAKTPNIGVGPLNLVGADQDGYRWMICFDSGVADTFQIFDPEWQEATYCPDGSSPKHISWQRVYHKNADGSMSFYEKMVGTMEYHPSHSHMHFDEWTIMTLRIPDPNNMDNPTEWEIVGEGAKVGFCVMDLGSCSGGGCRDVETTYGEGTELFEEDFPNYGLGGGSYGCSPVSQGISSGYTDTYGSYLGGMFLNIPLGTCNGDYAVVLEVPQVMVESNMDNNYSWFPITLTQQSQGTPPTTVTSSAEGLLCEGELVELSVATTMDSYVEWSNGMTGSSIEVTELGNYTVTVVDDSYECPFTQTINLAGINNPDVEPVTSCRNEVANLYASSENDITWYDSDNNVVGEGESFQTPILTTDAMYYVSSSISSYNTAPLAHAGDNEYSTSAGSNGYIMFDALSDFTLASVDVFTNEPGERKIMLWDEDGNVVASHIEDVSFSDIDAHTIALNFNIAAGEGYILGTDTATNELNYSGGNPLLKRTDEVGLNYPYVLDGLVSIENSPYGTDWYYYFYNWSISIDPIECSMVSVPVTVEDCSSINENILSLEVYPNPSTGKVSLSMNLKQASVVNVELVNIIGEVIFAETLGKNKELNKTFDWSDLSAGIYTIQISSNGQSKVEKIIIK
jgi:hypothetical protein